MSEVPDTHARATQLVTTQGKTTIADEVVSRLVTLAAKEIDGIQDIGGQGLGEQIAGLTQRITGRDQAQQGIRVEVGEREVAIDVQVIAHYGVRIPDVMATVRQRIIDRIEGLLGLVVKEVNIQVSGLYFPEEKTAQPTPRRVE